LSVLHVFPARRSSDLLPAVDVDGGRARHRLRCRAGASGNCHGRRAADAEAALAASLWTGFARTAPPGLRSATPRRPLPRGTSKPDSMESPMSIPYCPVIRSSCLFVAIVAALASPARSE